MKEFISKFFVCAMYRRYTLKVQAKRLVKQDRKVIN